jgi:hypothetical protein
MKNTTLEKEMIKRGKTKKNTQHSLLKRQLLSTGNFNAHEQICSMKKETNGTSLLKSLLGRGA